MEFNIITTQTYKFELAFERQLKVTVTKKEVVEAGYCENVVDGDPTAWKDYVQDYINDYGVTSFIEKNKASISKEDNADDIFKKLKEHIDVAVSDKTSLSADEFIPYKEIDCNVDYIDWL